MVITHIILAILWTTYCLLHSVLASLTLKRWIRKTRPSLFRYYRLFYTIFAAVSLGLLVWWQFHLPSTRFYAASFPSNLVGGLTTAAGVIIMCICIQKYFLSLSGLKSLFQERPASELMIAGIHQYLRHPLYLGTFLAIWGAWIIFPSLSLAISNSVITLYTLYAIRLEEDKLVLEFGDQYRRYQQTVPKLIPRL